MTGIELFTLPAVLGGGAVTAGGALSAAGLAAGVGSQLAASNQQAGAARQNAANQRQAGHNELLQGEAEAARISDQGRRQRASAANVLSGSGIEANSGSAAGVLDDLTAGSALDASIARWRGSQAAAARNQQAEGLDQQARQIGRAKWWQAGTTLLTGGPRLMARADDAITDWWRQSRRPAGLGTRDPGTGRIRGPI